MRLFRVKHRSGIDDISVHNTSLPLREKRVDSSGKQDGDHGAGAGVVGRAEGNKRGFRGSRYPRFAAQMALMLRPPSKRTPAPAGAPACPKGQAAAVDPSGRSSPPAGSDPAVIVFVHVSSCGKRKASIYRLCQSLFFSPRCCPGSMCWRSAHPRTTVRSHSPSALPWFPRRRRPQNGCDWRPNPQSTRSAAH